LKRGEPLDDRIELAEGGLMGKRGPKPRAGRREPNGQLSRRNVDVHDRADVPHVGWFVYFATAGGLTKIGFSGNVKRRLYMLGYDHSATLRLLGLVAAASEAEARALEATIHKRLIARGYQFAREWFDMSVADVNREIERLKSDGLDILVVSATETPRALIPRHKFSDAEGRKFAGIAARA
jgi:hypothetical protein